MKLKWVVVCGLIFSLFPLQSTEKKIFGQIEIIFFFLKLKIFTVRFNHRWWNNLYILICCLCYLDSYVTVSLNANGYCHRDSRKFGWWVWWIKKAAVSQRPQQQRLRNEYIILKLDSLRLINWILEKKQGQTPNNKTRSGQPNMFFLLICGRKKESKKKRHKKHLCVLFFTSRYSAYFWDFNQNSF